MKIIILGNGIAGLTAATTIREHRQECEIILLTEESYLSYSRPMITKAPFKGFDRRTYIIQDAAWYQEQKITVLLNKKVSAIKPENKTINLDDGTVMTYDKCIYALGAKSLVPPIPGANQDHVLTIRGLDDMATLRMRLLTAKTAVIIGGGVIGLEMAWELQKAGLTVTVLEQAPRLMGTVLDEASAQALTDEVTKAGVKVRTAIKIDHITKEQVKLEDKTAYNANIVILACGIKPTIDLAIKAGIDVNRGVIVNEKMETNLRDIYACGDCAEFKGTNYGLWEQAIKQARVAGVNSCGGTATYQGIDKALLFNGFNTSLFAIGKLTEEQQVIVRKGDTALETSKVNNPIQSNFRYEKYFFSGDRLVGGVLLGDLRKMNLLKEELLAGENKISRL